VNPQKDDRVSGSHCELFTQDGIWYVRDKGSLNGTFVDDKKISEPTVLRSGANLNLGGKGPAFVVEIIRTDGLDMTMPHTRGNEAASTTDGTEIWNSF
jgi:pSer/pThr/pTyr-binding forkhead associated (FHA) protein